MRPIVDFKITNIDGLYRVFHNPVDETTIRANSPEEAAKIYCNFCLTNGEEVDIKDVKVDDMYYFEQVTVGYTMSNKEKADNRVCVSSDNE